MVPPVSGVRPERARKSLSEKLDTVALNSPKTDACVSLYGEKSVVDEIFLEDAEMVHESGLKNGESSPFVVYRISFCIESSFLGEIRRQRDLITTISGQLKL